MLKREDKFIAIEGLRGWLAWSVVLGHLAYMSAFSNSLLRSIGPPAVLVFVIVSGFVITHLILKKQEPYRTYLVKRFARLYPLFALTCLVGFFANDLLASALGASDFSDPQFAKMVGEVAASNHDHLPMHLLAHATMLHGAIPNAWLPYSEYAFNMPAWSISLEWQFYLIAPLIVMVLRDKQKFIIALALTVAILQFVFKKLFFGAFQPGALPVAACYFATGILSRLAYSSEFESYKNLRFAVAFAIVFFPFVPEFRPFLIWLVVYFGLSNRNFNQSEPIGRIYELALKSPLAQYFGSRSYSIYLCHYPVISIVVWLFFSQSMPTPHMLLLSCICIPLTIVVSELAHRYVEVPGIALGKRIATSIQRSPIAVGG